VSASITSATTIKSGECRFTTTAHNSSSFRLKVESAVTNAKAFLAIQNEFGAFSDYIWGFVDGKPIQNKFRKDSDVPATSPESDALSKDLKKRGFRFVGSTIIYAHMQATGMVNDHVTGCFRHKPCAKMV